MMGYMPASGHWRFRGMTGSQRSGLLERDGAIVPRKRLWPDAGMYPVTRGGLILLTKK